jgi:hypothetical protein
MSAADAGTANAAAKAALRITRRVVIAGSLRPRERWASE